MLLIDAHEDIAWNALTFNRDVRRSAADTRQREARTPIPTYNGSTLLGKDDWLAGEVAVIFATLFASPIKHAMGSWETQSYRNAEEAHKFLSAQLDYYHKLTEQD